MNPNIIGGLIKRVYPDFSMFDFNNRLRLQKFTYLLQHAFDLNLGYEFNWFTYGPYCMELTKEGFQIDFDEIKPLKFADEDAEKKFGIFLEFFEGRKNNNEWLEIASSSHLLRRLNPSVSEEEIVKIIMNKREELKSKEKEIRIILKEIKNEGLIK